MKASYLFRGTKITFFTSPLKMFGSLNLCLFGQFHNLAYFLFFFIFQQQHSMFKCARTLAVVRFAVNDLALSVLQDVSLYASLCVASFAILLFYSLLILSKQFLFSKNKRLLRLQVPKIVQGCYALASAHGQKYAQKLKQNKKEKKKKTKVKSKLVQISILRQLNKLLYEIQQN